MLLLFMFFISWLCFLFVRQAKSISVWLDKWRSMKTENMKHGRNRLKPISWSTSRRICWPNHQQALPLHTGVSLMKALALRMLLVAWLQLYSLKVKHGAILFLLSLQVFRFFDKGVSSFPPSQGERGGKDSHVERTGCLLEILKKTPKRY